MGLARRGGVSLWRQVQIDVEQQIMDGRVKPGDRLPTEAELSTHYGVNRHTVRRALSGLEDRGLIRVEQGRGTFVQEPVLSYHIGRTTRFTDNARAQSRVPSREVLEITTETAVDAVAAALGLTPGALVTRAVFAGAIDGRRIVFGEHYFSAARMPGLGDALLQTASITEALRMVGLDDYRRKQTRVGARMPSGREADLLAQPRSRPILVATSINVGPDDKPVEYVVSRFNSDWVEVVFEP